MLNYKQFIKREINIDESLITNTEELLESIEAEETNLFDTFKLNRNDFDKYFTIQYLFESKDFEEYLKENSYKKTDIESTEDYETFLKNSYDIRFFCIYGINQSTIEKPKWIIIQMKEKDSDEWTPVRCYVVNGDMNRFYDIMTSRTIEIKDGENSWIYWTSNSGEEWVLKNVEDENDEFKEYLTSSEIKDLLKDGEFKFEII
jgi:hypothetical protein